jgi:hypothetical protein
MIGRLLGVATTLVLAAAVPLSVIAVRGYWRAPFNQLLRPLPVVLLAVIGTQLPGVLAVDAPIVYTAVISSLAVAGAFAMAVQAMLLLTGRQKL